jgi:hypothetical protein
MIVGDPYAMRGLADRLSADASRLRDAQGGLQRAWGDSHVGGPWGDELGFVVSARGKQYAAAADKLDAAVKTLRSSATQVEDAIEAERRRLADLELQRHLAAARAAAQNRPPGG